MYSYKLPLSDKLSPNTTMLLSGVALTTPDNKKAHKDANSFMKPLK